MVRTRRLALGAAAAVASCLVAGGDLLAGRAVNMAWAQTDRAIRAIRFASGDIERATHGADTVTGSPQVEVRLSGDAAGRLRDFTTAHVGRLIEIRMDGRVLSRPVIREPITGGRFVITGRFTVEEARAIATAFGAGNAVIELVAAEQGN